MTNLNKAAKELPPAYRLAQQILREIELAVHSFTRYHKYTIGSDLRRQAMMVMRLIHRAVFERVLANVEALVWAVEDLKLSLQLACDIGAFTNIKKFAPLAELAVNLSKQCGGWRRSMLASSSAEVRK